MASRRANTLLAILALALGGCGNGSADREGAALETHPLAERTAGEPFFDDLAPEATGIDFDHRFEWDHPRKHLYQHGYAAGGVAVGDYDGDGRPDLYLVGQTRRDGLYRQVGDLRFEEVSEEVGLTGISEWGTGASFADVDGDGDLDLYVCNYDAPNLLFVNRGDGTFREQAAQFGLDFRGASVMAAFADADLDGDLDMYLLTNRLYPGPGEDIPRTVRQGGRVVVAPGYEELYAIQMRPIQGRLESYLVKSGQRDRLYFNNGDGTFSDVSAQAGISGNHPGLSVTWWDPDADGDPDLYVGNDFWDADRFYRNDGDGTFTDILRQSVPYTPWFTMGADAADINNDGLVDLLAADMSATTHYMSKIMMGDMDESRWFLESANPRQYMRNALYLNTGTERFMEVAFLAGVASTDWTWSVKFGDLDNDGRVDLFVTNGTANHSFDPDLTRAMRERSQAMDRAGNVDPVARWQEQWALYRAVPPRHEANLAFRNRGNLDFEDVSRAWGLDHESISFGAALADLDRDGDLDVVVNGADDRARVYRNQGAAGHGVLVRLVGRSSNRFGVGATVRLEASSGAQVKTLHPTSGYMSANEPLLHFGLGEATVVDRLEVRWPSGHVQTLSALDADRLHVITEPEGPPPPREAPLSRPRRFREVAGAFGLDTGVRIERPYDDYRRQPLLPAKHSQMGPPLAWGDCDADGDDDLYVGGPAGHRGSLFVNGGDGAFAEAAPGPWAEDAAHEDLGCLWLDSDGDGDLDLYVASGSVECEPGDPRLRDRLYVNRGGGHFERAPDDALAWTESTGTVVAGDYDRDGDLDLFVGARVIPGQYPLVPHSRLLRNDGGRFVDATEADAPGLDAVGLVTAALWSDADGDGWPDLLVSLEWGPVALWRNTGGLLRDATASAGLAGLTGWWNGITGCDLDGDGDVDYVVTNAGLNTKYHASAEKPASLYYGDLEGDAGMDLLEIKAGADEVLPVRGLSCLSTAMPFVRERTPTYREFAASSAEEIFAERMEGVSALTATCLESGVLVNEAGTFSFRPLPRLAQAAPGQGVVACELDGDGYPDVYVGQNFSWREPETGRWTGGLSLLLRGGPDGALEPAWPGETGLVVHGDARGCAVADADGDGRPDLAVTQNNGRLLVFRNETTDAGTGGFLAVRLRGPAGNPTGVGARVTVIAADGHAQTAEVYAGSGALAQSSPVLYFGRGARDLREVRVRWIDGRESVQPLEPQDRRLLLYSPGG